MKHIIVLHDAFTNPTMYWYPQIASIVPAGYSVITPELPSGAEQGMEYWLKDLEQYRNSITPDTIIISHGISSLLALRFAETFNVPIRNYISIAGCCETPAHQVFAPIAKSFLQTPFNWQLLQKNVGSAIHIWNTQDPFIESQKSKQFAELLPGQQKILTNVSHFTDTNEVGLLTELQNIFQKIQSEDEQAAALQATQVEQQKKEALAKATVQAVKTYDTDVAQSIAGYQGKVISELLTEARIKEAEQKQVSIKNPKNIFYIIGSIVLLIGSIVALGYAVIPFIPKTVPIIQSDTKKYESSLLRVETIKPFEFSGIKDYQVKEQMKAVQKTDVTERTFLSIVPTFGGEKTNLQTFVSAFDIKFPVGFADKADDYVYGYYQPANKDKIPFLLVQFQGYDIMYSIMRSWEETLVDGTLLLFAPDQMTENLMRSETVSFNDIIVSNIPFRTATLSSGYTITYGFLTDQTLLITTSAEVAEPIVRRMIGR
jgi:predicted alpha/beta hydrolase family esterase